MQDTSQKCRFYIVRHGETEWNMAHRMQGQQDSPLTEEGIRQAYERGTTFKDLEFADAFSSDLFRAQRTAEVVTADHDLVVKTTQLLRERSFGQYEGRRFEDYQTELRQFLEAREALSETEQWAFKPAPDIESDSEIVERMMQFIRETAVAYPGKNVLVVAHGGIMRATLHHLGFYDRLQWKHTGGAVKNLGYFVLESDGIDFTITETVGIVKPEDL